MPPKKKRTNSYNPEYLNSEEDTLTELKEKKKIEQVDSYDTRKYLAQLGKMISHSEEQKTASLRGDHIEQDFFRQFQERQQYDDYDPVQEECMACLQSQFEEGKYILGCKHVFCNQCFVYWSNVTNRCPCCARFSHQILSKMNGKPRVQQLKLKYKPMICQNCQQGNNQFKMYYCDLCRVNCVHVKCQPTLKEKERKGQEWICQECKKKRPNYQPRRKRQKTIESMLDLESTVSNNRARSFRDKLRKPSKQVSRDSDSPNLRRSKRH